MSLQHRDVITAEYQGEQIEVYNRVNVMRPAEIRGGATIEYFQPEIGAGDSRKTPDYITDWVAEDLWFEYNLSEDGLANYGIEVVDVESEEVTVV